MKGWSLEETKERISSEEFESWKVFYKATEPGGPRTPEEELMDILAARQLAHAINCNRVKGRIIEETEIRIFKPKMTPEMWKNKAKNVAGILRSLCRPKTKKPE